MTQTVWFSTWLKLFGLAQQWRQWRGRRRKNNNKGIRTATGQTVARSTLMCSPLSARRYQDTTRRWTVRRKRSSNGARCRTRWSYSCMKTRVVRSTFMCSLLTVRIYRYTPFRFWTLSRKTPLGLHHIEEDGPQPREVQPFKCSKVDHTSFSIRAFVQRVCIGDSDTIKIMN